MAYVKPQTYYAMLHFGMAPFVAFDVFGST